MRRWIAPALALAWACATSARPVPSPSPTQLPTAPPTATPPPTASPPPTPSPVAVPSCEGEGCFDVARAMAHDRVLAVDIGVRLAGTEGDRRSAEYIRDELERLGLQVLMQAFPLPQGGESWNVIGVPPGVSPEGGRYLMVGGHRDTTEDSPGANDNGSGTAAVLEIARALAAQPAHLPVVVVAFGAEERQPRSGGEHHVGSRHYVSSMNSAARRNLVALVNLDMVGWGPGLISGYLGLGPREATDRLVSLGRAMGIRIQMRETPDWSDNGPFLRAGLNAGWLWAGDDPRYHSPADTIDHVQPERVADAGRLALAFLRSYR